jgi:magnesium-transporting ATPase (P-type)
MYILYTAWSSFFFRVDILLTLVFISVLLAAIATNAAENQIMWVGHATEFALLVFLLSWNAFLFWAKVEAPRKQLVQKAKKIVHKIAQTGMNTVQEIKIPSVPSVPIYKVVRDGVIRSLPAVLLVEGDIIELHYGDIAPAKCRYVYAANMRAKGNSPLNDLPGERPEYALNCGEGFRPSLFGIPPPRHMRIENQLNHGRFQFELLESPVCQVIQGLTHVRPRTIMSNQLWQLHDYIWKVTSVVYVCSLIVALIRWITMKENILLCLIHSLNVALPFLPLTVPSMYLAFRVYSNAHINVLWEELQTSKTDYEDIDEDEFDVEAPPPTKEIRLHKFDVLSRALSVDTSDLTESLSSISVLCFLDREGTLTEPFPSVDQIYFPDRVLDVAWVEGRPLFEDRDWADYLPLLKPLGLAWMTLTHCDFRKSDPHRNLSSLHIYAHTKSSRQTCLCPLARLIGFQGPPEYLSSIKEIFTVAPYHTSLEPNDSSALAVIAPNLTHTPGAAGTSNNFPDTKLVPGVHPYAADLARGSVHLVRSIPDEEFEIPSVHSAILKDAQGNLQLVSTGSVESILDLCTEFWASGLTLGTLSEELEQSIHEWYLNACMSDHQVVAYSYRPIMSSLDCLPQNDQSAYLELPYHNPKPVSGDELKDSKNTSVNPAVINSVSNTYIPTLPGVPQRQRRKSDAPTSVNQIHALLQNQIFLGLSAFAHEPKEDVCDVIEDVGLAGIRFVYFSPTNERQTKAFGDRLGLDTDWNSCILLSTPRDPNASPGYVEMTDIKAQLPRGPEAIRQHLREVDDIPLHVSLFAESSPKAVFDMIRIFQENGEVVCCLGSTLNHAHTPLFRAADIGVGIHALPIKPVGSRQFLPPLTLGAGLVTLPCSLVMPPDTSLYALTQLIRESRRLGRSARQGFWLMAGTNCSLVLIQFILLCFNLPLWRGWIVMSLIWISVPIVGCSFASNPHEPETMKEFTERNIDHIKDIRRFCRYFIWRFCFPIVLTVLLYWMVLAHQVGFWQTRPTADLGAELIGALVFFLFMTLASATFVHRTRSVLKFSPFQNRWWCVSIFLMYVVWVLFLNPCWHFFFLYFLSRSFVLLFLILVTLID